ncbi:MAG: DMT family transporter [Lentimicrobiaceae bacterium]|jgi:drug/metabolite transporter (DMT)-like permease
MHNQSKAYSLALISIAFWSTMGTAFKLTLNYLNPGMLLLIATFTAFIFLGTVLLIKGKLNILKKLTKKQALNSALMGLFNPFLYYLVLFEAYNRIPAQEGVALNYIWPVILVIFSIIFLKQHITLLSILAIIISFSGTVVIAMHGNFTELKFSNTTGVILAIGSAFFWASFWIINMKDPREAIVKMFVNFAFGAVYILSWNIYKQNIVLPPIQGLGGAIYIGVFEMGLTFVLWLTALKLSTHTARVSNLVFISPFISLILVSIIVGEKILLSTVAGLAIIVSGIVIQQYSQWREKRIVNSE